MGEAYMNTKKMRFCDMFFILSLCVCTVFLIFRLQNAPNIVDESFYPTIALRLINGDSLVTDEWHLSQFSALFLYLPVKLWLAIRGSTNGIVLFLRCLYLCVHFGSAIGLYTFFRKHGWWAMLAALLFYSQSPMGIMSLNYNSLFALFLLTTCLLLLTICRKPKNIFFILTGACYACACVCNPIFCGVFLLYITLCLFFAYKNSRFHKQNIILSNKERKKQNKKLRKLPQKTAENDIFFNKKAFLLFLAGICLIAVCCLIFFFATGGTLSGFVQNFKHLLTDSEHNYFNSPLIEFWKKLKNAASAFNTISFGLFFLPIVLFVALALDKKRKVISHKIIYICLSLALGIFYIAGITTASANNEGSIYFYSLPLLLLSAVSYILTANKNKKRFYCFWLPCAIAALAQFLASNLLLWAIGWVFAIGNIAGVFFVKDLFCELKDEKEKIRPVLQKTGCILLCLGCCIQLTYNTVRLISSIPFDKTEFKQIETGPYENLYINNKYYGTFELSMSDLDKIKTYSNDDEPILLLAEMTWLYLYVDRPFGTYSAWQLSFEPERLEAYYELNPEKKPKYIYISAVLPHFNYGVSFKMAEDKATVMKEMFNCKEEKLSRGILLTVIE